MLILDRNNKAESESGVLIDTDKCKKLRRSKGCINHLIILVSMLWIDNKKTIIQKKRSVLMFRSQNKINNL